jgi:hypothetical protein
MIVPRGTTFESAQEDFRWWVEDLTTDDALLWLEHQMQSLERQIKNHQVKLWAARDLKAQYEQRKARESK